MLHDVAAGRRLSVVVAAWTGREELQACLKSLMSQVQPGTDEVIVARNFASDGDVSLQVEFPSVIDLPLRSDQTVPRLRAAAFAVATGAIVAFLEDHCVCAPGWRDAIVSAHDLLFDAVGGPVDLAPGGRPLDWAAYFYDYARFAPPRPSGPVASISGANASYKRAALDSIGLPSQDRVSEAVIEREFTRRGLRLYLSGSAIVVHKKRHSVGNAIRLTFNLARGYAAERLTGAGALRRVGLAVATVLLPALLFVRILAATVRSRRHAGKLLVSLPWLAMLLGAWSFGECTGYLTGAGASHLRWR